MFPGYNLKPSGWIVANGTAPKVLNKQIQQSNKSVQDQAKLIQKLMDKIQELENRVTELEGDK